MNDRRNRWGLPRMFANIVGRPGSTNTTKLTQIFNQALPWFAMLAVCSLVSLGMALSQQARLNDLQRQSADMQSRYEERLNRLRDDFSWKIEELKKSADAKEREIRMLEYYVVQTDQKLVAKRALKQSDTWSVRREK